MKQPTSPTSMQGLRLNNHRLVLKKIEEARRISRTELARATALSPASVTMICDTLRQKGLIREIASNFSLSGRRPVFLEINKNAGVVVSLLIDSTHTCSFCISNLDYCLLLRRKITFRDMDDLLDQMEYCMGYTTQPVLGMAVSLEWEYNWETNGSQPVHNLSARQLEQLLEQRFSIPVQVMEHNLICLKAYQFFFQSASFINPVYLHFDDSISVATLSSNGGSWGDMGHITFSYHNPKVCYCGKVGCARMYCSPAILVSHLRRADGSPEIHHHVASYADALLMLCDSAARLYSADCLILGGEIAYLSELLNPVLAQKLRETENALLQNLTIEIADNQDALELKGTCRLAAVNAFEKMHFNAERGNSRG